MKIAVLSSRYPSENKPYNHMFVHTRNKNYQIYGHQVKVFVPSMNEQEYVFENIAVKNTSVKNIINELDKFDVVLIHLIHPSVFPKLDSVEIHNFIIDHKVPTLFFIHGIDFQKIWQSRRNDIDITHPRTILRFLYQDFFRIQKNIGIAKKYLANHPKMSFVSVSHWALKNIEKNLNLDLSPKTKIIPNGIDTQLFSYKPQWNNRHKLLSIRPLQLKGAYAIDLALKTALSLKNKDIHMAIYGDGRDAKKIQNFIKNNQLQKTISLHQGFMEHHQIPKIHNRHGIYYAVTKMDTQGVSMCEAMASGLPVISFDVAAISEFVQHNKTGLLIQNHNIKDAVNAIENLSSDKNLYYKLTENARKFVEEIDITKTTHTELQLARQIAMK